MTGGPADLLIHTDGPVRVLTLNRPHVHNAINTSLGAALHAALVDADADAAVRCVVITGAGDRAFSAGGDMKEMGRTDGPAMGGGARVITDALRHRSAKPLIAAVNGLAYGGGLELLLACDLVVCGEHARFALPEVQRGIVAAGGGLVRLPRLLGRRRALQLILTGTPIDAATALSWGLVNDVVASGTELAAALALAATIAANAPVAVAVSKQTAEASLSVGDDEAWALNTAAFEAVRGTADATEGPRAFTERRPPRWTGAPG